MIPANSLIVKCPHCGGKKELLQLVSGNTCGSELWSDVKQIAPMLPKVSPVQKCPECGHYYLLSRIKDTEEGNEYSFETGWLSFDEAIEANREIENLSFEEQSTMSIITIWAYNDIIRNGDEPSSSQYDAFMSYVKRLLDQSKMFSDNILLRAELYREIGNYEKSIELLDNFTAEDDFIRGIKEKIKEMAANHQNQVFKLETD